MSRPNTQTSLWSTFGSLGWPLILGGGLTVGFYALMYQGPLNLKLVHRYFAGHPINMVETTLFFIGFVALAMKLLEVFGHQGALGSISLGDYSAGQPISKCSEWLDLITNLPATVRASYLGKRLTDALESVERKGTADGLDEELKYLSDMDIGRQQDSYSLVRIIIWATPMLGFLGTVVGITDALGDLAKQDMGNLKGAMTGLLSGLYVAFDTTAIALCFSMVLMFIQFMIDRMENQVLTAVDHRVAQELLGRFEAITVGSDPNVAAIQRMAQSVVQVTEQLVARQAALWESTIDAAHERWRNLTSGAADQMQGMLSTSLSRSLEHHADHLARAQHAAAEQYTQQWQTWQQSLGENTRVMHAQQQELVKQGELMKQAIQATGDVVQLERALNDNLSALASTRNFEEAVMTLSAAMHLLTAKLGKADAPAVDLKSNPLKGRAA